MFPNSTAPISSVDEATMLLSNHQLMTHMQQNVNPGFAFGQQSAKSTHPQQQPPFIKPPNGNLNSFGPMLKSPTEGQGMPNTFGQMMGNPNQQRGVSPGILPGPLQQQGQAALMQALMQAQQGQFTGAGQMNGGGGPINGGGAHLMNNSISTAAAGLATQQVSQARLAQAQQQAAVQSNQAKVAAYLQQQQASSASQQQHRQNMNQHQVGQQQQPHQSAAWLNAAVQRALASGQLVMQNGKPVLVPPSSGPGNLQQQQQQGGGNSLASAAVLQQLQAAQQAQQAAQKQAQQMAMIKQLGMAYGLPDQATQRGGGATPNQSQLQAAFFKQAQIQDVMSAVNGRAQQQQGAGGMSAHQQVMMGGSSGFSSQQQQMQQAQAQALAQQRIRQNMSALASLMPGQLHAIGNNPALAQLLLARGQPVGNSQQQQIQQLAAAMQQQQMSQQMQQIAMQQQQGLGQQSAAAPIGIPGAGPEALMAALRGGGDQRQRQTPGAGGVMSEPSPGSSSPHSSTSPPGTLSKESRRMALACIALQLAHSGVSVDQAIHSGIMGGMSVTDVRFILDVVSAESTRMKEQGIAPENPEAGGRMSGAGGNNLEMIMKAAAAAAAATVASNARQQSPSGGPSVGGSPTGPSSCAGSESGGGYAKSEGGGGGTGVGYGEGSTQGHSRSRASSVIGVDRPGSVASAAANLQALSDPSAGGFDNDAFNAFSYGFFGGVPAEGGAVGNALLEELGGLEEELDGKMLGELGEVGAWMADSGIAPDWSTLGNAMAQHLQESAGPTHLAQGLGQDHTQGETQDFTIKQDDVATRLANLDLGSGFF